MVSMPSRSSASPYAGSLATCRCTSSLKLRVSAIRPPSPRAPAAPVIRPQPDRRLNIPLLPLLGAAGQQDHQRLAVAPEIHPVSRPEIDPVLEHAFPDALHVRQVALFEPRDRH